VIVLDSSLNIVKRTYTLPTNRTINVYHLSDAYLMAICTEQAFYLTDYDGNIALTVLAPAIYTKNCRIAPGWYGVPGEYYLTAASEQLTYIIGGIAY
jgi:hypothetical protein